jgi:hypothetical protein
MFAHGKTVVCVQLVDVGVLSELKLLLMLLGLERIEPANAEEMRPYGNENAVGIGCGKD